MNEDELWRQYVEGLEAQDAGDFAKSFALFLRGAEAGYANAQNALALAYDGGYGVERDKYKAIEWLKKAWRSSHEVSFSHNLALIYAEMGQRRRAHYWWKRTFALTNDPDAGFWFAKFLLESKGHIDYDRVIGLVEKAANGDVPMNICENDRDEARKLLRKLKKQLQMA